MNRYQTAITYKYHDQPHVSGRSSTIHAETIGEALEIALDKVAMGNKRGSYRITSIRIEELA